MHYFVIAIVNIYNHLLVSVLILLLDGATYSKVEVQLRLQKPIIIDDI